MNTRDSIGRAACVLALALCTTTPSLAKDSGFYLGFSAGQTKFDAEDGPTGFFDVTTSSDTDDNDTALSLSAGYRFNPYLGIEASLSDLGDLSVSETGRILTPGAVDGILDFTGSAKGPALSVTGSLPLKNFEFYGKVGAMYAETKLDIRASAIAGSLVGVSTGRVTAKTTEALYGVGMGYAFAEEFFLRIEWVRIPDVGDEDETGENDLDVITAGFHYRF